MSYNTDLQNNNTSLEEILAKINALPEAGGSGESGSEDPANVYIYYSAVAASITVWYTDFETKTQTQVNLQAPFTELTLTCLPYSSIVLVADKYIDPLNVITHIFENVSITANGTDSNSRIWVFQVTGGSASIRLQESLN